MNVWPTGRMVRGLQVEGVYTSTEARLKGERLIKPIPVDVIRRISW